MAKFKLTINAENEAGKLAQEFEADVVDVQELLEQDGADAQSNNLQKFMDASKQFLKITFSIEEVKE